jgi:hypothetical protein
LTWVVLEGNCTVRAYTHTKQAGQLNFATLDQLASAVDNSRFTLLLKGQNQKSDCADKPLQILIISPTMPLHAPDIFKDECPIIVAATLFKAWTSYVEQQPLD